jgi:hypothetical protein
MWNGGRLWSVGVTGTVLILTLIASGPAGAQERAAPRTLVLGKADGDLVYTPVAPCRIIDTRLAGGAIAANATRSFVVAGNAGFAAQGGNATGCGIPDQAAAVMINFVAVGATGPGDLRAFAYAEPAPPAPLASVVNYSDIAGLNIANGVVVPTCNPGTTTCTFDIIIQADVSATDVAVDVLGYFAPPPPCPAGTSRLIGWCFETGLRSAVDVAAAADVCSGLGGRLAAAYELRSLRTNLSLAAAPGEWTDSAHFDGASYFSMTVDNTGLLTGTPIASTRAFRCTLPAFP